MAKFTRLESSGDIFSPVRIPSSDDGSEAMAQVFGKISEKFAQTAIQVGEEKSTAALYQAPNQLYRLHNETPSDFLTNPDQVKNITKNSVSDVKKIVQQTPLNERDRQRLEYLSNNDITDIETQGVKVGYQHAQIQAKTSFIFQWPEKLQQIHDSWNKDEKTINYQYDNSQKILSDALVNGYISQHQYKSLLNTLHSTFRSAEKAHQLYTDQEVTAKDYHKARYGFDKSNNFSQIGAPSNETTNFLYRHEISQRNVHDVLSSVYNGNPINPQTYIDLKPKEQEEVDIARNVVIDIESTFNSGGSWDEMESIHKSLDDKKDNILTTEERAAKTYLDNFFQQFTPDKYLKIVSETPIGAEAVHEHNMVINAIDTNGVYSNEQKESLKRNYDNIFTDKMVSAGIAKNIPTDKVMPIPSPMILNAQSSFDPGGDPMKLLQMVDHYNPRNRVYIAQAMKEPEQKEIAYTVGALEGKTSNSMRQLLIAGNQKNIDWSPIQLGKEGVSENAVKMSVQNKIEKISQYLSRFKSKPGEERGAALTTSVSNAVRYASLKRGEFDLSNYQKDIDAWGNELNKAYNIYSGNDYAFNRVQQPQVSDYEWASVAQYAIEHGHQNMRERNPHASEVDFMQSVDINPLYATITPDNYIVAQDQDGNIAFSVPFSMNLVATSHVKRQERIEKIVNKNNQKENESKLEPVGIPRGIV